jgi:hypothetical protein
VLPKRRPEGLDAVAAQPLGVVRAHLGVAYQLLGLILLAVVHGDADGGGEEYLFLAKGDRRPQRAPHGLGKRRDPLGLAFRDE